MGRQIITLTTDWNHKAYYAGAVKGALLKISPDANIVDISHNIIPFNILQTAFILKNSLKNFPDKTIHLIGVNSEINSEQSLLLVEYENQFVIGVDNGVFSLLFENETPTQIIKIKDIGYSTFAELYIFPQIVEKVSSGVSLEKIGEKMDNFKEQSHLRPVYDNDSITGHVVYIDSYYNAITNISVELFERIRQDREFDIFVQNNMHKVSKINKSYSQTSNGDLLAIFNTAGFLEIAIKNGPAASLLNLDSKSNIRVKFL